MIVNGSGVSLHHLVTTLVAVFEIEKRELRVPLKLLGFAIDNWTITQKRIIRMLSQTFPSNQLLKIYKYAKISQILIIESFIR